MMLQQAELLAHLSAMKNYFLLGAGDFYQAFLLEVGSPEPSYILPEMMAFLSLYQTDARYQRDYGQ